MHVELAAEPVGERDHSDWLCSENLFKSEVSFISSPDTDLGKPLEPDAVVGLSMIAPI